MALMITLGEGNSNQLILKVPAKGEQNWSNEFKEEFATKIVQHDHTGNGRGAKIGTLALENNAVTGEKLNASLQDLNNVDVSTATPGNLLALDASGNWVGQSTNFAANTLVYDGGTNPIINTINGWSPSLLDTVNIVLNNGNYNLNDPSDPKSTASPPAYTGAAPSFQGLESIFLNVYNNNILGNVNSLTLPPMKNCIIRANCDLVLDGNIVNCTIITSQSIIVNTFSISDSIIRSKEILNINSGIAASKTVFDNCDVSTHALETNIISLQNNTVKIKDSTVNVLGTFKNTDGVGNIVQLDITNDTYAYLDLENSKVKISGRMEGMFGFSLDDASELVSENYAQNNKEVVSLKMLRKDIGLLTTTFKDVNVNLNISLASNEYETVQNEFGNYIAADPISHWTDSNDGQANVGNYLTAEGDTVSGNWYRMYTHWFNQEVVFDNVNMTIDHSDYVWYATGASVPVDMVPSADPAARISSIVLPKIVRNSKIIVNDITSIPADKCIDIFQVSTNSTGVTYDTEVSWQTAPSRFDVTHPGRPYFTNSSISQSFINSESTTDINLNTSNFTAVEYRLINSTQSGTTSVVAFNSKFDIWNVVTGDSVVFENCKIYSNNEARFGDDIHLSNCDIKCDKFRLKSPGDTTHSGIVVEDSNIRCWQFLNDVHPSAAQSIKFHACDINGTYANLTNSTDLGIYFHDCNLTFSSYFDGTSTSARISFEYCTFNCSWVCKYKGSHLYFKHSRANIGRLNNSSNGVKISIYGAVVEVGYVFANSNNSTILQNKTYNNSVRNMVINADGEVYSTTANYTFETGSTQTDDSITHRLNRNVTPKTITGTSTLDQYISDFEYHDETIIQDIPSGANYYMTVGFGGDSNKYTVNPGEILGIRKRSKIYVDRVTRTSRAGNASYYDLGDATGTWFFSISVSLEIFRKKGSTYYELGATTIGSKLECMTASRTVQGAGSSIAWSTSLDYLVHVDQSVTGLSTTGVSWKKIYM